MNELLNGINLNNLENKNEQLHFLSDFYHDPETGFCGEQAFYHKTKMVRPDIPQSRIKQFFNSDISIQKSHIDFNNHTYLPIYACDQSDPSFQIDLVFMDKYQREA